MKIFKVLPFKTYHFANSFHYKLNKMLNKRKIKQYYNKYKYILLDNCDYSKKKLKTFIKCSSGSVAKNPLICCASFLY